MSAEQRNLIGCLSLLVEGDDSKSAASRGIPIDGQVLGVGLSYSSLISNLVSQVCRMSRLDAVRTFTRFVSQAFRLMRRLS